MSCRDPRSGRVWSGLAVKHKTDRQTDGQTVALSTPPPCVCLSPSRSTLSSTMVVVVFNAQPNPTHRHHAAAAAASSNLHDSHDSCASLQHLGNCFQNHILYSAKIRSASFLQATAYCIVLQVRCSGSFFFSESITISSSLGCSTDRL